MKNIFSKSILWGLILSACDFVMLCLSVWGANLYKTSVAPNSANIVVYAAFFSYFFISFFCHTNVFSPFLSVEKILLKSLRTVFSFPLVFFALLYLHEWNDTIAGYAITINIFFVLLFVIGRILLLFAVKGKYLSFKAILIGDKKELNVLREQLNDYNLTIIGHFSDENVEVDERCLGTSVDVQKYIDGNAKHINCVFSTNRYAETNEGKDLFYYCVRKSIGFYIAPIYLYTLKKGVELTPTAPFSFLLSSKQDSLEKIGCQFVKRMFDILISLMFLLTIFPIAYILVLIFIKKWSPGPVFAVQSIGGRGGKVYRMITFRSTHCNQDAGEESVTHDFYHGRFMMKYKINKLPMFLNVLSGDMSLVGSCTLLPNQVKMYADALAEYGQRYWVKPGLVTWKRVSENNAETGMKENPIKEQVESDMQYAEKWSLGLDLLTVFRNCLMIFKKKKDMNVKQVV